mmetsp:Transcript_49369/g.138267  ORF Transcript_49369/g.138267 Transcript_49369/m.138267 type:complete len:215 (+) Transcript_49369:690-1334(+)
MRLYHGWLRLDSAHLLLDRRRWPEGRHRRSSWHGSTNRGVLWFGQLANNAIGGLHVLGSWASRFLVDDDFKNDVSFKRRDDATEEFARVRHDEHVLPSRILLDESERPVILDDRPTEHLHLPGVVRLELLVDVLLVGAHRRRRLCVARQCSTIIFGAYVLCPWSLGLAVHDDLISDASARRRYDAPESSAPLGHDEHVVLVVVLLNEAKLPEVL